MTAALFGAAGGLILAAVGYAGTTNHSAAVYFKGLGDYQLLEAGSSSLRQTLNGDWISARPKRGDTNAVRFGSQVVVQTIADPKPGQVATVSSLTVTRVVAGNVFILQAADAQAAVAEAERLSQLPEVVAAYPVVSKHTEPHGPYAQRPADSWFTEQWPLEHRNATGASLGVDLNAREAWPLSKGAGVTIAIADTGIEMAHPELVTKLAGSPHYNFDNQTDSAGPISGSALGAHGTEVAGLAAAELGRYRMTGTAPDARLASWVIYKSNFATVSDLSLMDMYQYQLDSVAIQNHSWGHVGLQQNAATPLEIIGISNAVSHGRSGLGTVMVRSAGNDRSTGANANDDAYANDPRVLAIAAVRRDGRATTYSEPGACLLVSAPSGDPSAGFSGLFTTDLLGNLGVNQLSFFPPDEDLSGYAFYGMGFSGTSAAAPLVSGVVALMLSAHPLLTALDVQPILIASSRHYDFADPSLATNGAGFVFSHNTGFGVPDASEAVRLAVNWRPKAASVQERLPWAGNAHIPDAGLRLLISGDAMPAWLGSISNLPGNGPHADSPTRVLPLTYAGLGTNYAGLELTNRAALIQRGGGTFANSITLAAQAGAEFAIIFNSATNHNPEGAPGGDQLIPMGATDYVPIPAVFIGHTAGAALTNMLATNATLHAQLRLDATNLGWVVAKHMFLHNAGLRVTTDHPLRGDVRITLLSPSGTRSVLQRYNGDTSAGPTNWVYWSRLHFGESSVGTWTACISDEANEAIGNVTGLELILEGAEITDQDNDGLDDTWETVHFKALESGPKDDPDFDGAANSREWLVGSNPAVAENMPPLLDLSRWQGETWRLSWAGSPKYEYELLTGETPESLQSSGVVPGRFPVTEGMFTSATNRFFRIQATRR